MVANQLFVQLEDFLSFVVYSFTFVMIIISHKNDLVGEGVFNVPLHIVNLEAPICMTYMFLWASDPCL